jgi:hypothetical protein
MPKQSADTPHKMRLNYVWQAVEQLGRASPAEVCERVAAKMSAESGPAFKRNIYRDLQQLADAGEIGVDYVRPDGSCVENQSETAGGNFRAEYYSLKHNRNLVGEGQLREFGAHLYAPDRAIVDWRASAAAMPAAGRISILLPNPLGQWVSVSAGREQRPLKLAIARFEDEKKSAEQFTHAAAQLGQRAALLLVESDSVSRVASNGRAGHLLIEVNENNQILASDLGSSAGSMAAPVSREVVGDILGSQNSALTGKGISLQSLTRFKFQKIESRSPVQSPAILMAGTYYLIVI